MSVSARVMDLREFLIQSGKLAMFASVANFGLPGRAEPSTGKALPRPENRKRLQIQRFLWLSEDVREFFN